MCESPLVITTFLQVGLWVLRTTVSIRLVQDSDKEDSLYRNVITLHNPIGPCSWYGSEFTRTPKLHQTKSVVLLSPSTQLWSNTLVLSFDGESTYSMSLVVNLVLTRIRTSSLHGCHPHFNGSGSVTPSSRLVFHFQ